ncbi:MAG: Unknown protein [uncultured Thiotrichaceae bacterium]|uniref:Uncharacterized protein n=1 Tax=uncultured Thiotrichaceae bacterium TaxID=298394 RepID=A0A6S6U691_9GAMM|nr:MAG: Unknown protein [uncultured Thiotrichaceae bacterium]
MKLAIHTDAAPALRKNFTMREKTVRELEFLTRLTGKKQSQVIQELIHKESEAKRNELRLEKLRSLKGRFTGLIGEEQSIQRMKSERVL